MALLRLDALRCGGRGGGKGFAGDCARLGEFDEPVAPLLASVAGNDAPWGKLEELPVGLVGSTGNGKEGDRLLETTPERDGEFL